MAVSQAQRFEAEYDKRGSVVQGSRKAKIERYIQGLALSAAQKYMLMGYLGYSNANGYLKVKTYINGLHLRKQQKEVLFEMSGYRLENFKSA
jgi:hypothetical protein